MMNIANKYHLKRLNKKQIVIEEEFLKDYNNKKETLVRSTDGLRNDNVVNSRRVSKKYFYKNKCIDVEKDFDKRVHYTFINNSNNDEELTCPNCGNKGLPKDFSEGCPYCGTSFNIDYELKNYGSSLYMNNKISFLVLISIVMLVLLVINIVSNEMTVTNILLSFLQLPIYFFLSVLIVGVLLIIYISLKAVIVKNPKKPLDRHLINLINYELLHYYYDESKNPMGKDLIDHDILNYLDFRYYEENKIDYVNVTLKIRKIYFIDEKVIKKVSKSVFRFKKNVRFADLEDGYEVISCSNCGSSIDITLNKCPYCDKPVIKQEWSLDKVLKD